MKSIKSKLIVASLLTSMTSVSFADQSCIGESDPIGCWLQCTFGGHPPCPYDNSVISNSTVNISLPSTSSKEYKKTVKYIDKKIRSSKASSLKTKKKNAKKKQKIQLKQICSKSELLTAVNKYQDANKVKNACFKVMTIKKKALKKTSLSLEKQKKHQKVLTK